MHQACRPRWYSENGVTWNARQQTRDSVCFFCIEPCRDSTVWGGQATTAYQMRQAECVGRSADSVWNAAPIPYSPMKLFEECSSPIISSAALASQVFSTCTYSVGSDFGQTLWSPNEPRNTNGRLNSRTRNRFIFYSD